MRRKYFGWAIAAVALLGPQAAWAGDREIAQEIIERLKVHQDSGALKDFTLDMKVENGVVQLSGNVSQDRQKDLVLATTDGIEGIANVVDQVSVNSIGADAEPVPAVETVQAAPAATPFDMAGALAATSPQIESVIEAEPEAILAPATPIQPPAQPIAVAPSQDQVSQVAAFEPVNDDALVGNVISALGSAQKSGQLRGFGVDVQSSGGVVQLTGQARSEAQRDQIVAIVRDVPGVTEIHESIEVSTSVRSLPAPALQEPAVAQLQPMPAMGTPAQLASHPTQAAQPVQAAQPMPMQYAGNQQHYAGHGVPAQMAAAPMMGSPIGGVSGTPVPMAPHSAVGAPRYDTPNLPNYAWPGYAAHPNYAALTYPQQYSPSAWPYIGPFYPYPQVPMGWRKVSLEWDDGWWFLDFTDRDY